MRRRLILRVLLVFAAITVSIPVKGEIFTESGLVDIPTGAVLEHGIFAVGPYLAVRQNALEPSPTRSGDVVAIRLNFGVFDRIEIGVGHLWHEDAAAFSNKWAASVKVQLLKEQAAGTLPNLALGIEHFGDRRLAVGSEDRESLSSVFLSVSKTFNLPRIHQFSGHIGIGTQRFAFAEGPMGLFVGLSKEFQPAFARGDITMSLEFDGSGANAGIRYITPTGLQIALGAETLNDIDASRYLASVSWTNKHLLEQIDNTRSLIKRVSELVVAAKRAAAPSK